MAKEDLMALEMEDEGMEEEGMGEEEAMSAASLMDEELDAMSEEAAPVGVFPVRSLNALGEAVNKVLPLFDPTLPPVVSFKADVKGKLPLEIYKPLVMINAAANEAMLPDLAPAVDTLTDGRALEMAAGKVTLLGKNRDFQMFLKAAPKEREMPETEVEVKVETPVGGMGKGMMEEEVDALMMERM